MLRTLTYISLAVLLSGIGKSASAGRYACYFLINMYSCNNCNHIATQLNNYPDLYRKGAFLFSPDEVTEEQARDYLSELFDKQKKVVVNKKTYDILVRAMRDEYKIPHVAVFDSLQQKAVLVTSFDSLDHYRSVFNHYLHQEQQYHIKRIRNSRISRLIGWKTIAKVNNTLFVSSYQNSDKIYLYDLATNKLDSISISDATLKKLYESGGRPGVDIGKLRAYHKRMNLAMPMFQFATEFSTDGENYYTYLSVFYHDPEYKGDTIRADCMSFFIVYNQPKKQLKISRYEFWESNPTDQAAAEQPKSKYTQDFTYKRLYGDSLWIIAVEKLADPGKETSKTMMLARFVRDTVSKKWVYNNLVDSIHFDHIQTFSGKNLNAEYTYYPYKYDPPYFFFNEAPLIRNVQTGAVLNISKTDSTVDWILDVQQRGSLLQVLTQCNRNRISLYTFQANDFSFISKETIIDKIPVGQRADAEPVWLLNYLSNAVLDEECIYYVNKSGEIEIHSKN